MQMQPGLGIRVLNLLAFVQYLAPKHYLVTTIYITRTLLDIFVRLPAFKEMISEYLPFI